MNRLRKSQDVRHWERIQKATVSQEQPLHKNLLPPSGTWRAYYTCGDVNSGACDIELGFVGGMDQDGVGEMAGHGEDADGSFRVKGYFNAQTGLFAWSEKHTNGSEDVKDLNISSSMAQCHHMECVGSGAGKILSRWYHISGTFITSFGAEGELSLVAIRAPSLHLFQYIGTGARAKSLTKPIANCSPLSPPCTKANVHGGKLAEAIPTAADETDTDPKEIDHWVQFRHGNDVAQPWTTAALFKYPPPLVPVKLPDYCQVQPGTQAPPTLRRHPIPAKDVKKVNMPLYIVSKNIKMCYGAAPSGGPPHVRIKAGKKVDLMDKMTLIHDLNQHLSPTWEAFIDPTSNAPYYIKNRMEKEEVAITWFRPGGDDISRSPQELANGLDWTDDSAPQSGAAAGRGRQRGPGSTDARVPGWQDSGDLEEEDLNEPEIELVSSGREEFGRAPAERDSWARSPAPSRQNPGPYMRNDTANSLRSTGSRHFTPVPQDQAPHPPTPGSTTSAGASERGVRQAWG